MREKIREILGKLCIEYHKVNGVGCSYQFDSALSAITELLVKKIERMKKGKQGCVGFIEDEGDYNQALQDIIKEIRG